MSITVDELITKFSADISDYRKKTEEIKKQLRSVAGVTDIVKEETQKAMKSSTAEIRQYGNQLNNLLKTQTKQSQSLAQSASKVADYKQKVKLLIETLHEQENEVKSAADKIKELTALYKAQQDFLSDYDGGIDGVRKQRQEMIDYIHAMEAAGKSAYSTKEAKKYQNAVKRIVSDLQIFDNELKSVGLKPENLKTDTLSKLQSEIQKVVKEQSRWQSAQRTTQANIDSTNRSIVSETMKMEDLKSEIEKNARSINNLRSKITGLGKGKAAIDKLKKSFSSVGNGVRKIGSVAAGAFSKVTSWLKRIHSGSLGANKSLLNVTKSIKRIGIVSLGLKICKSIFGELRSVVSDYLSKNEALNKKVETLKNQFANALAPAISVVVGLFEKLMPYVISVANAISELFASLGIAKSINATATAINGTADATKELSEAQKDLYGFDKITKVSDDSSKGKSDSASAGTMSANEQFSKYLESIKELWRSGDFEGVGKQIADSFNKVISKINNLDWDGIQKKVSTTMSNIGSAFNGFVNNFDWAGAGKTVSNGVNTITSAVNALVDSVKWESVGAGISTGLNGIVNSINADELGKTLSAKLKVLTNTLYGFFNGDGKNGGFDFSKLGNKIGDTFNSWLKNIDWGKAASNISSAIKGLGDTISGAMDSINWNDGDDSVTAKIQEFFKNIDWGGMLKSACAALGKALGGLGSTIVQLLKDAWNEWKATYIDPAVDEAGGDIIAGVFNGIVNWLTDVGTWIYDNILQPFIDGFKSTFDIHSPSKNPSIVSLGENIITGVFQGIVNWISNVGTWLKTNVLDKITKAWGNLSTDVLEVKAKIGTKWNDLKDEWNKLKKKFTGTTAKAKMKVETTWNDVKDKWNKLKKKFTGPIAKAKMKVGTAWNDVKNKWKALKDKFTGKTVELKASFKDFVTGALNSLISRLNTVIGKLRSISVAGIQPFKNIKDIPKLAQGGIVDRSTLVNVGENGKEAIMPLEKNKGWIYELARQIVEINSGASDGQAIKITLPIYVGGKHLTTVVLNDINTMAKASREVPIII